MSNPTTVFEPLPNSSAGNPTTYYVVRFNLEPGQLQIPRDGAGTSLFLREDGTWASPPGAGNLSVFTVTLDAADLAAIDALTPYTLVAAPGAGKMLVPITISTHFALNGGTGGNGTLQLVYNTDIAALQWQALTMSTAGDYDTVSICSGGTSGPTFAYVNKSLDLIENTPSGIIGSDACTLTVQISYLTMTV